MALDSQETNQPLSISDTCDFSEAGFSEALYIFTDIQPRDLIRFLMRLENTYAPMQNKVG